MACLHCRQRRAGTLCKSSSVAHAGRAPPAYAALLGREASDPPAAMNRSVTAVLEAATVALLGVMSGFFFAFAVDVVPAMRTLDAAIYISTMQSINAAVRNIPFALAYFGSAVMPFVAAIAAWRGRDGRRAVAWAVIGVLYVAAVFWVTRSVNIPINDALAGWNPAAPPAGWSELRDTWNRSNDVRTLAALLCFCGGIAVLSWRRR
jgi:uncharacterized membrane protein